MSVEDLVNQISADSECEVLVATGMPDIPKSLLLPMDLRIFYHRTGGIRMFQSQNYSIEILPPKRFVRANPIIVGDDCKDDISYDWFIVARSGEQYITIDLSEERKGRCYDSFWDRHGVPGDCAIIATSFTELLANLYKSRGGYWYWLQDDFQNLGDAYD